MSELLSQIYYNTSTNITATEAATLAVLTFDYMTETKEISRDSNGVQYF